MRNKIYWSRCGRPPSSPQSARSLRRSGRTAWPRSFGNVAAQLGLSPAQIDALRDKAITDPAILAEPSLLPTILRFDGLLSVPTIQGDLEDYTTLWKQVEGTPPRDLTAQERSDLDGKRQAIEAELAAGLPIDSLGSQIDGYARHVLDLVESTGNLAALQGDLDFAQVASFQAEQFVAGPQGIRDYLVQMESQGKIASADADALRGASLPSTRT